MKRFAEAVLNGHPDKFCDLVADRIVGRLCRDEPGAYAQIEAAVWSDQLFLTGFMSASEPICFSVPDVVVQTGLEIGYTVHNHIDVTRYRIHDHICRVKGDAGRWTNFVNDQSIIVGYAGYDHNTNFLPPEHYLCWYLREAIETSLRSGTLKDQGPDGKILVQLREEHDGWKLERVLATVQQQEEMAFYDFINCLHEVLLDAYRRLQKRDARWIIPGEEVDWLLNPNGPMIQAGSDGDNGQTGRKQVMDFYGPRIPLGGGAFYGKDLSHIDRLGAMMARRYARELVALGAGEAMVSIGYAPGKDEPLFTDLQCTLRPNISTEQFFSFGQMRSRIVADDLHYDVVKLGSFYNETLSFNRNEQNSLISVMTAPPPSPLA